MAERRQEVTLRRSHVADLYLRGHRTSSMIAEKMGGDISVQTVIRDLRKIREEWKKAYVLNMDSAIRDELAKIDRLEREAWDAWEKSKTHREWSRASRRVKADGEESETAAGKEGLLGNPAYMHVILTCIDKRCKLLGLNAPLKHEVAVSQGINWEEAYKRAEDPYPAINASFQEIANQPAVSGNGNGTGNNTESSADGEVDTASGDSTTHRQPAPSNGNGNGNGSAASA